MSTTFKTLAAALALSIAAPAALAEKASTGVSVATVEYGDLDISKEAGAQKLLSRITQASKKVCGERPTTVMNGVLLRPLPYREPNALFALSYQPPIGPFTQVRGLYDAHFLALEKDPRSASILTGFVMKS